jgi:hypothetical protein
MCLNHFVLICDATNGNITVTLPDSNSIRNVCIVATKRDSTENRVDFVCRRPNQKINGDTKANLLFQNDSINLFPGANKYVIGSINQTRPGS